MNEEKGLQKLEKCFEKYTCLQNAQKFVPTFRILLAILAYEIYLISIKKDNTKAKKWLVDGDQLCNSILQQNVSNRELCSIPFLKRI